MAIQYSDANNIIKMNLNKGENCNHIWEKEYYLATNTGDYRCVICGDTISKETYDELKKISKEKRNEEN